jgi:hypothetical protein
VRAFGVSVGLAYHQPTGLDIITEGVYHQGRKATLYLITEGVYHHTKGVHFLHSFFNSIDFFTLT